MYETGELLPVEELPAGAVLLCSGPPMIGKRELVMDLLGQGVDRREATVVVATDRNAMEVQSELASHATRDLSTAPLGIIEAAGTQSTETPAHGRLERVGSPTDLTGIGIGVSNFLERFRAIDGTGGIRVGVLSLSTMLLYSDPERVLQFLHVFGRRVKESDALAVVMVHTGSLEPAVETQIASFVDGAIDVREREGARQVRVRGIGTEPTDWTAVPTSATGAVTGGTGATATSPEPSGFDSLAAVIASVEADRPTLTIANYTGDEARLETIEDYFRRLKVGVRTTGLGLDSPTDVALLHRGSDLLTSASVVDVEAAIAIEDESERGRTTDLLDAVDQTVFDAGGEDKRFLVQVSHTIETLAMRTGEGRIHAGFQELSRLWEDSRAREIYRRIAERGVDVHVYGRPDADVAESGWTIHPAEDGELTGTWFVGFTAPEGERTGTLIAEERADGYYGFWSYRADLVRQLDAYLRETYGDE